MAATFRLRTLPRPYRPLTVPRHRSHLGFRRPSMPARRVV